MSQKEFRYIIHAWRGKRGWTQEDLAEALDVSVPSIKRWENGRGLPQGTIKKRLVSLTEMNAEELGLLRSDETTEEQDTSEPSTFVEKHSVVQVTGVSSPLPVIETSPHRKLPLSTQHPLKRPVLCGLVAALILLSILVALYQRSTQVPVHQSLVAGTVSLRSSNQIKDGSNQGINDIVQFTIQPIPNANDGKTYYAWLEPANPENPSLQLGTLSVHNGIGTLVYRSDNHANLLDFAAHFVITEQESTPAPLGPSLRQQDQKYIATIPNIHPTATSSDPHSQEYSQYGLLDHLRHLLSSDPTLLQSNVSGGLVTLLDRQADQVAWWAKNARDTWESGTSDPALIRDQVIRMLNVLDGITSMDSPPTPILVDRRISSFALLPRPGQTAQESYISHVDLHLRGVRASPGASQLMRDRAALLIHDLVGITADLHAVRENAEKLYAMSDTQLKSEQAFAVLNDLFHAAKTAYAGPSGVFALFLATGALTQMDLLACTGSLCRS